MMRWCLNGRNGGLRYANPPYGLLGREAAPYMAQPYTPHFKPKSMLWGARIWLRSSRISTVSLSLTGRKVRFVSMS
ncbi:hypothetical protein SAMN05444169_7578 [Bradyrhizobium erythrophlei]|jgi:hypothetical protein|uniref:Uncharacterized protein n=1 Tax=Bradyrhizobium erythrophlei TaxID=1437360 RepID=A0A1M5T605_9BRAD|nr:hypothetical protein SAMN05444169_7578 [Bradyrhizobium erythrophlei]